MNEAKIIDINQQEFKPTQLHHQIAEFLTEKIFKEGTQKYYGLKEDPKKPFVNGKKRKSKDHVHDQSAY